MRHCRSSSADVPFCTSPACPSSSAWWLLDRPALPSSLPVSPPQPVTQPPHEYAQVLPGTLCKRSCNVDASACF